ncbi:hypothetical protein RND71_011117 [Anisodus tanguticus]|uniref:Uncharacterized protein n=1 Tax=Anisodus tanguticus TaxID=243964 RepID=A0AAE1SCQ1_9SOLA|nr:hypothetical protein RND71_011117 [Anisodus tanguticus]
MLILKWFEVFREEWDKESYSTLIPNPALPTLTASLTRMKQQPAGTFNKQGIETEQMQVKKTAPLSIVAVESDNAQVSAMEEDESSVADDRARPGSLQKHGRRYRTRAITTSDD